MTPAMLQRLSAKKQIARIGGLSGSIFGNECYSFDGVGNRTASHRSSTYGYQSNNRLTSTATATYGYDANGVMTSKTDGSTNWTYNWDLENRMVSADNGTGHVDYAYDALGRRVSRDDGTQLTNYTFDGRDVLMDDDSVSGISTYQNGLGIDNKLKVSNPTASSYFLADHLGSTNALTDTSGSLTDSNSYDSFGNATNSSFSSRYQYTGREFDSFTGLQYNRARWYDPAIGRFISEDPIGLRGGINPFAYVHNNPANHLDPLGLNDDDDWAEQVWRAQQDLIEALQRPIQFGYGFGDAATAGVSKLIRNWEGLDDLGVECTNDYKAGWWTATAIQLAEGGYSLYKGAVAVAAELSTLRTVGLVNTFTRSSLTVGRDAHAAYMDGLADGINTYKEFRGVPGVRPDFVDLSTRTIYELKPYNPRGILEGTSQLERYREAFESFYGGTWNTVLHFY